MKNYKKKNSRKYAYTVAVVGRITFVHRNRIAITFAKPEITIAPLSSAENSHIDVQNQRPAISPLYNVITV